MIRYAEALRNWVAGERARAALGLGYRYPGVNGSLVEYAKDESTRDLAACDKMVNGCFASQDYKEGQTAFTHKRKPVCKGK